MAVIPACSGVYIDGSRYSVYATVGVATTAAVGRALYAMVTRAGPEVSGR